MKEVNKGQRVNDLCFMLLIRQICVRQRSDRWFNDMDETIGDLEPSNENKGLIGLSGRE